MIALFKAIPLSVSLTLVVTLFIGTSGSPAGVLEVFGFTVEGTRLYWSWTLFCAATALAWTVMLMRDD